MNFLSKLLPWIGAAATGNVPALITMAAKAVGDAVGGEVAPTVEAIADAVSGATPEQLTALKQADAEFKLKAQALGFQHETEMAQIAAGDRDSARKREVEVKDNTPKVLAAIAIMAFAALLLFVATGQAPAEAMRDGFWMLAGALAAFVKDVYGYYFGSSAGSAEKTRTLADLSKGAQ